ncbi:MAG TPA: IclR family transcriptional regulator [Chloroflexota bacterium]|nr:IclR family transcriptional regulator [Chloroflexota bacterium]
MAVEVKARYVRRDQSHYAVQSLDRAIDLIEAFHTGADELGVAELAQSLDLPRATVHRLLASLTHRGFLAHNEHSGKYRLGLKLFELGSLVGNSLDVKSIARPYLSNLVKESGETAHLVILDGVDIVFVDKVETDNPFRMVSQIGVRLPARHSGSGKALLAQLDDDELTRRFAAAASSERGGVDLPRLQAHLATVRAQGWAIDDQETQAGLRCIGTVIRDHTGAAIAGVSISGPIVRIGDERILDLAALLCSKASAVARALGYRS